MYSTDSSMHTFYTWSSSVFLLCYSPLLALFSEKSIKLYPPCSGCDKAWRITHCITVLTTMDIYLFIYVSLIGSLEDLTSSIKN